MHRTNTKQASIMDTLLYPLYGCLLYGPFGRAQAERDYVDDLANRRWQGANRILLQQPFYAETSTDGAFWTNGNKAQSISSKSGSTHGISRNSSIIFALSSAHLVASDESFSLRFDSPRRSPFPSPFKTSYRNEEDDEDDDAFDIHSDLQALPREIASLLCASNEWQLALQMNGSLKGSTATNDRSRTTIAHRLSHAGDEASSLPLQQRSFGLLITSQQMLAWNNHMKRRQNSFEAPISSDRTASRIANYRATFEKVDRNDQIDSVPMALVYILERYVERLSWNRMNQSYLQDNVDTSSAPHLPRYGYHPTDLHRIVHRLLKRPSEDQHQLLVSILAQVVNDVFLSYDDCIDRRDQSPAVSTRTKAAIQPGDVALTGDEVRLLMLNFHAWVSTHNNHQPQQQQQQRQPPVEQLTSPSGACVVSLPSFQHWLEVVFAWHFFCLDPSVGSLDDRIALAKKCLECLPALMQDDSDTMQLSAPSVWSRDKVRSLIVALNHDSLWTTRVSNSLARLWTLSSNTPSITSNVTPRAHMSLPLPVVTKDESDYDTSDDNADVEEEMSEVEAKEERVRDRTEASRYAPVPHSSQRDTNRIPRGYLIAHTGLTPRAVHTNHSVNQGDARTGQRSSHIGHTNYASGGVVALDAPVTNPSIGFVPLVSTASSTSISDPSLLPAASSAPSPPASLREPVEQAGPWWTFGLFP